MGKSVATPAAWDRVSRPRERPKPSTAATSGRHAAASAVTAGSLRGPAGLRCRPGESDGVWRSHPAPAFKGGCQSSRTRF